MIEQKFQELANEYGSKYNHSHYKVNGTIGSKLPISIYTLQIVHLGIPIDIKFEFGNYNLAEFNFAMAVPEKFPEFEITTRDNLTRLFSFNKKVWKIACKDESIILSLMTMLDSYGLTELAKNEAFEPHITGALTANTFAIKTVYYLGFNNKEQSLKIVADFNKALIENITAKFM